jgi:hypothetical protein
VLSARFLEEEKQLSRSAFFYIHCKQNLSRRDVQTANQKVGGGGGGGSIRLMSNARGVVVDLGSVAFGFLSVRGA